MARYKIYEKNLGYTLLKPIVDWNLRHSYRRVEVQGYENIPDDGALLFTLTSSPSGHSRTAP